MEGLGTMSAFGRVGAPSACSGYAELMRLNRTGLEIHADPQPVVTFLIEPNALLREGMRRILADTIYNPFALASNLGEIDSIQVPGDCTMVFIIDAARDHEEACRQVRMLKEKHAAARVVMLVEQYDLRQVLVAFRSGADAYLLKSISCEVFVKVLDLATLGEPIFPAATLDLLRNREASIDFGPARALSEREVTVIRCLMAGDANKVIARKLEISEATVKVHVKTILRKIRAKNRTQVALWGASHLSFTDALTQ